ncbi:hypothetical protein A3J78_01845 [Candidatus Beckwithbacteria bacterium RBG_13_35_6]|uniref:Uncharacterized protein n=1 Tax=Candidatus Beckwithbacteria bacterium RBG_13_35_6 TaxID=1797456 RepID=A0A1F5DH88_9BACT|nr:MAG: hypothetical protein A3J78_01845 [Candidatus Beckwithbacteria bacterium RBG_13_35_6]
MYSQAEIIFYLWSQSSQKYEMISDPSLILKGCPRVEDYDDIRIWQFDYDKWYRNQSLGNCPNFAGHF